MTLSFSMYLGTFVLISLSYFVPCMVVSLYLDVPLYLYVPLYLDVPLYLCLIIYYVLLI